MKRPASQYLLLFFTGVFIFVNWACSQPKRVIRDSYGYYAERQPGNIPVDNSGNPLPGFGVDTIITIYITTAGKNLKWDTAWAGNKTYTIVATSLPGSVIEAGIEKEGNQPSVIKAGKGLGIWRLDLIPSDPPRDIPGDYLKEVLIKGEKNGKPFEIRILKLVELWVPPSV